MKKLYTSFCLLFICLANVQGQHDTSSVSSTTSDSLEKSAMNLDAVYERPLLKHDKIPAAIGGYLEADYSYSGTDGINEGHSFRIPRLTVFLASGLHRNIKFLTEIEFEEGGKEINIEFASLDFTFHPLLNLRGGIIMNPIGAFNQNHDGPKWDFVDRPVAMTELLPATWSNVGFGLYGKYYRNKLSWAYELYLSNGFNDAIISNEHDKTFLPASKSNAERFEESNNGKPLFTAKLAGKHEDFGELGLSYMGGVFNTFAEDGLILDDERRLDVFAIDYNGKLPFLHTTITGEFVWIRVDVPQTYGQQYATRQHGGFIDVLQPFYRGTLAGFEKSTLSAGIRLEYVDWNRDTFRETGTSIADDFKGISAGISFRPGSQTVLRANYRFSEQRDLFGNPPAQSGKIQLGFASYF